MDEPPPQRNRQRKCMGGCCGVNFEMTSRETMSVKCVELIVVWWFAQLLVDTVFSLCHFTALYEAFNHMAE